MRQAALFLTVFIFIFCGAAKAEEIPLTLDEAIAIALRDNRDFLLKAEDVKKAKEKIAEAQADLFPALSFTGAHTFTRGLYAKDLRQTSAQATLKQYLYKGGRAVNTIKKNKYELEVSQALLEKTRLETVLNVKKAFYTLLLSAEFANLNKDIVANTQGHLNFVKERFKIGQASESDVLNIEAALQNVKQAYEASLNQAQAAQILLNNLLYLDEANRIKAEAKFAYEPVEIAYDEAFLKAIALRPEIRQYEAQIRANIKAIAAARADNRPNIYASWDYYSRSTTSLTFSPNKSWQDYNIIGVTFSWPVFDGWQAKAKVEQAIVDLRQSQLLKEKAISDIALEVKNTYLDLKNSISKIEASESDAKVYSDNLSAVRQKHGQGIASFLDMDDANLKYEISAFNKKQALYEYIIARNTFYKAAGGI